MPPLALANLFWLGREHPLFRDLTLGEKLLLGLGRPCFRKILLGKGSTDNYTGLQGNTILLAQAQAATSLTLPPTATDLQDSLVVAFCRSIDEVKQTPMLMVRRNRYLECAATRKRTNPVYARASLDQEAVARDMPENGVPSSILKCAVPLPEGEDVKAEMDGPAKRQLLFTAAEPEGAAVEAEEDADASEPVQATTTSGSPSVLLGFDVAQDPEPATLFSVHLADTRREAGAGLF